MDKSEFKAAVVSELGVKVEDMAESAKLDVAKNEGAKEALIVASKKVMDLSTHVDKDLDEGLIQDLTVAKEIKRYLSRAASILESGSISAENHRLIATGRMQGLQLVVANMGKIRDAELEKSKQRKSVEVGLETVGRPTGIHPGLSIKEQRNSEVLAKNVVDSEEELTTEVNPLHGCELKPAKPVKPAKPKKNATNTGS